MTCKSTAKLPLPCRSKAPLLLRALGAAGKVRAKKNKKTKQTRACPSTASVTPTAPTSAAASGSTVDPAVRREPGLHMVIARRKGVGFARSFSLKGGTPRKARRAHASAASAAQVHTNDNAASRRQRSSLRSGAQSSSAQDEAQDDGNDSDGQWF